MKELILEVRRNLQDEEIAATVIVELRRNSVYSSDSFYRGVNADEEILERIRKTGTDRCASEHRTAALQELRRMQEDYEDVTFDDALLATDPAYVWLNRERNLDESVRWARKGERNHPAILVFSGEVRFNQPKGLYVDYYKFNNPAMSYLVDLVLLRQ